MNLCDERGKGGQPLLSPIARSVKVVTERAREEKSTYLRPLSIVLVFARKSLSFEPIEHLGDGFGGLGEHGFKGDAC